MEDDVPAVVSDLIIGRAELFSLHIWVTTSCACDCGGIHGCILSLIHEVWVSKCRRGGDCEQQSDFVEIHVWIFGVKENIDQEVSKG